MKLARPPIPSKKRAVRARAWRKEGVGGRPQHQSKAQCGVKIPPRPSRSEAFPPSWYQDIKAKQFSNPFKRKRVARQIQKIERKLFCFARRVSAGGNAGAGVSNHSSDFRSKKVRASFSNCGDILAMQACVDGDDEIWEESESSTKHKITSPDSSGTTNNCSRIERFYIKHPNYTPTGSIESGDCTRVQGWARDGNTTASLQVNISVSDPDGSNLQNVDPLVANGYRADLEGNYGIEWIVPDSIKDGNSHVVRFSAVNIPAGTNPEIGNISLTCASSPVQTSSRNAAIQLLLQQ